MNALLYSINEILHQIPRDILHAGMMIDENDSIANLTTIEDKILNKVLKKRVLLDANIIGGIETIIPLTNVQPSYYEQYYTIYNIPSDLTMNKEIMSVLGMASVPINGYLNSLGSYSNSQNNNGVNSINGNNAFMSVANRMGDAISPASVLNNTNLELVGYNTVLVYANYRLISNFGIRVVLENESNLNNIQPRSYKNFSMMCVLATKAYLYNKLIIPINSGMLAGGQDLGVFKSILESYSSAEDDYRVFIKEVWGGVAYMNDNTRYSRFLGSMLSPDL